MNKKRVFIDLRYLEHKSLASGFGQYCLFFGNCLKENPQKYTDLDITLFVPEEFIGKFGDKVKYLKYSKKYKYFPFLLPRFDIAHSTSQQVKYTPLRNETFRIITIHDLNFMYERLDPKKIKRKLKQTKQRIKLADIIGVISEFTQEDLRSKIDIKAPIVLNYAAMKDITNDNAIKHQLVKTNRKFFFTVGLVVEKKNFHVLLDMMKLMPDYDLYISGSDHMPYAQMMRERIEDENIKNVFMTGRISHEEKVWFHKHCYAFVFPSKFEGFGLPIIEAMSFDKPVFSSRMTSLPEVGGEYAFFWDNFTPEHMKEVMMKNMDMFYGNKEYRKKQLEYAFSYSIERNMDNYLQLYRNIQLKKKTNLFKTLINYYHFTRS